MKIKHFSTPRLIENEKHFEALLAINCETRNIESCIQEKRTGKSIQTKDINNVRQHDVNEKAGGLSKGSLLGNALKDLTVKIQATILV